MNPPTLGPFVFVTVGGAAVRLDRIEAVSDYGVTTVSGAEYMLGDRQTRQAVLADMAAKLQQAHDVQRYGLPVGWHGDGAPVDDGPPR
jgi:hypothetical protein